MNRMVTIFVKRCIECPYADRDENLDLYCTIHDEIKITNEQEIHPDCSLLDTEDLKKPREE